MKQVGVGVPGGAEAAVHATRKWFHRNAGHVDKVLLKLHFRNAFNAVSRSAVLRAGLTGATPAAPTFVLGIGLSSLVAGCSKETLSAPSSSPSLCVRALPLFWIP